MGQIQNALNQLAGSMMGLGLGVSHSPYIRGQRAIKQSAETIASLQEAVVNTSDNIKTQQALQRVLTPEITQAYNDYENAILAGGTKEQKDLLYRMSEGEIKPEGGMPYMKYEDYWPGARSMREAYLEEQGEGGTLWDDDALKSIKKAYEAKSGVKNSVLERYQAWLDKPPVEAPANPGTKPPKPMRVVYQNPGYKPFVKPETVVERGETAPETPDTYVETPTAKLDKPGSRLYKG